MQLFSFLVDETTEGERPMFMCLCEISVFLHVWKIRERLLWRQLCITCTLHDNMQVPGIRIVNNMN